IDRLLDAPAYAGFWALKWADVFRASRRNLHLKGTIALQQWLCERLVRNAPFDETVRLLLTARGSTAADPAGNFTRAARSPEAMAEETAQLFLGIRIQCAKCHNHPFERWTQDDYAGLAAFFARVKQKPDRGQPGPAPGQPGGEVIFAARSGEVTQPRTGQVMKPKIMGVPAPPIPPGQA